MRFKIICFLTALLTILSLTTTPAMASIENGAQPALSSVLLMGVTVPATAVVEELHSVYGGKTPYNAALPDNFSIDVFPDFMKTPHNVEVAAIGKNGVVLTGRFPCTASYMSAQLQPHYRHFKQLRTGMGVVDVLFGPTRLG